MTVEKFPVSPIAQIEERTIDHAFRLQFGEWGDKHLERKTALADFAAERFHAPIPLRDDQVGDVLCVGNIRLRSPESLAPFGRLICFVRPNRYHSLKTLPFQVTNK